MKLYSGSWETGADMEEEEESRTQTQIDSFTKSPCPIQSSMLSRQGYILDEASLPSSKAFAPSLRSHMSLSPNERALSDYITTSSATNERDKHHQNSIVALHQSHAVMLPCFRPWIFLPPGSAPVPCSVPGNGSTHSFPIRAQEGGCE